MSAPVPNRGTLPTIRYDKEGNSADVDNPIFNEVYIGNFCFNISPYSLAELIDELGFPRPVPGEVSTTSHSRHGVVKMRSRRDADKILRMFADFSGDYDGYGSLVFKLTDHSKAFRDNYGISLGEAINANEGNPTVEGAEKANLETDPGEMTKDTLSAYVSFKKLAIKEKEDLEEEYCKRTKNIQGQLEALSVEKKAAEEQRKTAEKQVAEARKKAAVAQAVMDAVSIARNELLEEGQRLHDRHLERLRELDKTAKLLQDEGNTAQRSRDKPEETKRNMMTELECICCFEHMTGHIFQCEEGHLICEKCFEKVTQCPTCREPFPQRPIRCRLQSHWQPA